MIGRLAFVFIVSVLASGATAAQPSAPSEAKPTIDLKLSATSLMTCVDSSLPLTLEITNRGTEDIKVDKFEIWNRFRYGFMGDRPFRGGGMGSSCNCQPELVVVSPGQTYTSSFNFDLKNDFFKDAGKYDLQLMLAGVQSNEIEFELFNCQ